MVIGVWPHGARCAGEASATRQLVSSKTRITFVTPERSHPDCIQRRVHLALGQHRARFRRRRHPHIAPFLDPHIRIGRLEFYSTVDNTDLSSAPGWS